MSTTLIRGTQIQDDTIPLEKLANGFSVPTSNLTDGATFTRRNGSVPFVANQSMGGFRLQAVGAAVAPNDAVNLQTLQDYLAVAPGAPIIIAAIALSGHIAVVFNAAGEATPADAFNPLHGAVVMGVTSGAAAAGDTVILVSQGHLEHLGWTFTPDLPVYLGAMGALVQTVPLGASFVKVLGMAQSATQVAISLQPAIFVN